MGEYTERLASGGELIVSATDWKIKYYFPGPDRRYNGTFFEVPGKDIDKYISAWRSNYKKYLQLKGMFIENGTYETSGDAGMMIRVGGYFDGVSIFKWHMNVNTQMKINQIVKDYGMAKEKAIKIQALLKSL